MAKFSGSGPDRSGEINRRKQLAKHATMQDDVYRKKYEYRHRQRIKLPTWVLVTIYVVIFAISLDLLSSFNIS